MAATATLPEVSSPSAAEVLIENVGPIAGTFVAKFDGPGAYVLGGDKGAGKSTAIRCFELLAGHKVELTVHDGELAGTVEGFGVVVPVGGRKRARGEFELNSLDSERFSISDITDPPGKSAEVRDAHRIKALASLCRTEADPKAYWGLVGGQAEFDKLVDAQKVATDDPVLLASRIKDAFEQAARLAEAQSDNESGHAEAFLQQSTLADSKEPHDQQALAAAVDQAVARETELRERTRQAGEAKVRRQQATEELAQLKLDYKGPTVEGATADLRTANAKLKEADTECLRRKKALEEAQKAFDEAKANYRVVNAHVTSATNELRAAEHHAKLVAQCEATIEQDAIEEPRFGEMAEASIATKTARAAQERGVLIREAQKAKGLALKHQASSDAAKAKAEFFRSAARSTFDVLTASVKIEGLRIESPNGHPRLVVAHKRRAKTPYDELSDGERVRSGMKWLAPLIPAPGIFPVSQRLWQDLPPEDRRQVDEDAKKLGLIVIGAQVSSGELRIERVGSN